MAADAARLLAEPPGGEWPCSWQSVRQIVLPMFEQHWTDMDCKYELSSDMVARITSLVTQPAGASLAGGASRTGRCRTATCKTLPLPCVLHCLRTATSFAFVFPLPLRRRPCLCLYVFAAFTATLVKAFAVYSPLHVQR